MMPLLRPFAAAGPAASRGVLGYWLGGITAGEPPTPVRPEGDFFHTHYWAAPFTPPPPPLPEGTWWHERFWPAPSASSPEGETS